MKFSIFISLMLLGSCATMNEKIAGHPSSELYQMRDSLKGKSPQQVKEMLGTPAADNTCSDGVHRLVYLQKTTPRYSFALDMSNNANFKCTILDFHKNEEGQHVHKGSYGIMAQSICGHKAGAINRIRKCDQ